MKYKTKDLYEAAYIKIKTNEMPDFEIINGVVTFEFTSEEAAVFSKQYYKNEGLFLDFKDTIRNLKAYIANNKIK